MEQTPMFEQFKESWRETRRHIEERFRKLEKLHGKMLRWSDEEKVNQILITANEMDHFRATFDPLSGEICCECGKSDGKIYSLRDKDAPQQVVQEFMNCIAKKLSSPS
jgi:fructose-1,6-bisphosphatase